MKKFILYTILILITVSSTDAQCKRGEKLRITNDVEIKITDCREATRLIYNEGWYPYSVEGKTKWKKKKKIEKQEEK